MSIAERLVDKIVNNHHILIENRLCSRFRTPKSDCRKCAGICPSQAINISNKGAEIKEGCIDCGVCVSVCPNGVFRIDVRDDKKIINEIGQRIKGQVRETLRISCEYGDITSDITLTCLGRLTEVLLLEPLRIGRARIEILRPRCHECPNVKASPRIDIIIKRTLHFYEMIGIEKDSLSVITTGFRVQKDTKLTTSNNESKTLSRRELLRMVKQRTAGAAVEFIPAIMDKSESKEEVFRNALHQRYENINRSFLVQSLKSFLTTTESPTGKLLVSNKVNISSDEAILAEIEVNAKCTGCGVCATVCPTGAIIQKWTEDHFYLYFRPHFCTNCQVCVKTCRFDAINIKERVSLNLILEDEEIKIFEAGKKRCIACRLDFIGSDDKICPLCIDRHKKQMRTIKEWMKIPS